MKTKIDLLLLLLAFNISFVDATPPKKAKLTVNWSFTGIIDGYDHDSKCIVYIDGEQVGESTVTKQSVPNSITVAVPKGSHKVKIQNYAFYEGHWEEHLKSNTYSLDAMYEGQLKLKKKNTITLLFDIDKEQTTSTVK